MRRHRLIGVVQCSSHVHISLRFRQTMQRICTHILDSMAGNVVKANGPPKHVSIFMVMYIAARSHTALICSQPSTVGALLLAAKFSTVSAGVGMLPSLSTCRSVALRRLDESTGPSPLFIASLTVSFERHVLPLRWES